MLQGGFDLRLEIMLGRPWNPAIGRSGSVVPPFRAAAEAAPPPDRTGLGARFRAALGTKQRPAELGP